MKPKYNNIIKYLSDCIHKYLVDSYSNIHKYIKD